MSSAPRTNTPKPAAISIKPSPDGKLANGWLGRGLTRIKSADVDGGRKDLEVAATLEPTRAFLRSYLGKAWSLDKPFQYGWNSQLAIKDLGMAKRTGPERSHRLALLRLVERPAQSHQPGPGRLEHSQDLNTNRAVFRSKFLLDQDQAVRSANLALIYQDAGFTDVAVREATKAVEERLRQLFRPPVPLRKLRRPH